MSVLEMETWQSNFLIAEVKTKKTKLKEKQWSDSDK